MNIEEATVRIEELEKLLEGKEIALRLHEQTRECMRQVIAGQTQPILSAVVASEAQFIDLLIEACNASFDCGEWNEDEDSTCNDLTLEALVERSKEKKEAVIAAFRAALASAPAQPVAAIPEATEMVTLESAQQAIEHMGQYNGPGRISQANAMLVHLPAIPEAGQSVPKLTDADILRLYYASEPTDIFNVKPHQWVHNFAHTIERHLASMSADAQSKGQQ